MKFTFEQNIFTDLCILDTLLTGKDSREGRGDWDSIGVDSEEFSMGGREFYLSDGGYSRVCFGYADKTLFLTSNSRDEVEARWEKAATVRRRIEHHIKEYLRANGVVC